MQATSEERSTVIKINNKSVQSRNFNGFIGKSDPELTFHQRFLKRVQIRLPRIRSQSFATGMTQKNVFVVGGNVSESDVTKSGTAYKDGLSPLSRPWFHFRISLPLKQTNRQINPRSQNCWRDTQSNIPHWDPNLTVACKTWAALIT